MSSALRKAAEQALEALEHENTMVDRGDGHWEFKHDLAAAALRDALAEPEQEPVAWTTMPDAEDWLFISGSDDPNGRLQGEWTPLYTSPPQLKPLTDEEMKRVCVEAWSFDPYEIARAIERAHGIKENS